MIVLCCVCVWWVVGFKCRRRYHETIVAKVFLGMIVILLSVCYYHYGMQQELGFYTELFKS